MKAKRKERVAGVTTKRLNQLTKSEMITTIQKLEAALWLALKETEDCFGADNDNTIVARARWSAIHDMMKAIGIHSDVSLSDNLAATEIIIRRIRANMAKL